MPAVQLYSLFLQLGNNLLDFLVPFLVELLFIGIQLAQQAKKFSGMFFFLIGDVDKNLLCKFVVRTLSGLLIKLYGLVFRCDHKPNRSNQFLVCQFSTAFQYGKGGGHRYGWYAFSSHHCKP